MLWIIKSERVFKCGYGTYLDIITNKINDLHSNNLGYYENKPIIIDYAGYDY